MQLTVGDIVEGKITAVKDYGVFVELDNSKFGMVHISEIAQSYVSEIRDFVKEGDTVKRGDVIAKAPEGALGVSIHASIDGKVTAVTSKYIKIG